MWLFRQGGLGEAAKKRCHKGMPILLWHDLEPGPYLVLN